MVINIWNNDETLAAFVDDWTSAVHTEEINGINSLRVSLPVVNENLIEGNYLGFYDVDGAYQMFEIVEVEETHDGVDVYAEHVICELNSDIVEDARPYNQTAEAALNSALNDTRWTSGTVADLGLNSENFYFESARSAIAKIVNTWGGELRYRLVFSGNEITHRYVDLLEARGSITGKRFEYKKDIVSIRRTVSMDGVITACYGRGKGEEVGTNDDGKTTYGKRLSFADEVWTTPTNPANKPAGQKWVGDDTAKTLFGYGSRHRMGVFLDDEETDSASLLQKTWDYLQANNTPKATYDLDVLVLETLSGYDHEKVRLGDTVVVNDSELGIALSARVIRIEADLLDPEKSKLRLGNYIDGLTGTVYDKLSFVDRYRDRQGFYDDGSTRAKTGLDASGYVDLPIYGQKIVGTTAEDGLNMTNTHMGYYNDAQSAWRAYIDNLGNFLFQKDANNYFKYDSTNFTFRGPLVADDITTGKVQSVDGSSYFDLDNGKLIAGSGNNIAGMGVSDTLRFWAGHATPASAPFKVNQAGVMYATNAQINGTGNNSLGIGVGVDSTGSGSVSLGNACSATESNTIAIGRGCVSCGAYSLAIGQGAYSEGEESVAIGSGANCYSDANISIGRSSETHTLRDTAIGNHAWANNYFEWEIDYYYSANDCVLGTDGNMYLCTLGHPAALITKPITGDLWDLVWSLLGTLQDGIAIGCLSVALGSGAISVGVGANVYGNNSMALGKNALVEASNTIRIGNSSVTSIGGYANWTNVSDERDKSDITACDYGLDVVSKIKPIKYKFNPRDRYVEFKEEEISKKALSQEELKK